MILNLTKENLKKCGYPKDEWEDILSGKISESVRLGFGDLCVASHKDQKIYSDLDAGRKLYFKSDKPSLPRDCRKLLPEYFDMRKKLYLKNKIDQLGKTISKTSLSNRFLEDELGEASEKIINLESEKTSDIALNNYNLEVIDTLKDYILLLKEYRSKDSVQGGRINEHSNQSALYSLGQIWKEDARFTIEKFLQKGYALGLWDENNRLATDRSGAFGTGRIMIASLYVALKGKCFKHHLSYKVAGEILCNFFGIDTNPETKEPFKAFQSANNKYIEEFKKHF